MTFLFFFLHWRYALGCCCGCCSSSYIFSIPNAVDYECVCVCVNMSECLVYIFGICNRAQFCTKIQKNIVSVVQLKSKNDEEVLRAYTKCMCVLCFSAFLFDILWQRRVRCITVYTFGSIWWFMFRHFPLQSFQSMCATEKNTRKNWKQSPAFNASSKEYRIVFKCSTC